MSERDPSTLDARPQPRSIDETAPPRSLGRYAVRAQLGEGGMGEVLSVSDPQLQRDVAAKVAKLGADPDAVARLAREARITGALEHPSIIPVHELAEDAQGRSFYTMKQVAGRDLRQLLEREQLPLNERLRIFLKLCEGVGYAHAKGVVHRDLKPANVMVGRFGEVLLMDFGLARLLDEEDKLDGTAKVSLSAGSDELAETLEGEIVGTPAFMSPEQARGCVAELDARSDIYALGAILYQLLTGEPPYSGQTVWETVAKVSAGPPEPPSERAPELRIPRELDAVVMRAMAPRPSQRYQDAAALAADIGAFLEGRMLAAASYTSLERLVRWARRNRGALLAAAAAVLAAGGLLLTQAVTRARALAAQRAAVEQRIEALSPAALLRAAEALPERTLPPAQAAEQRPALASLRELTRLLAERRELAPADPIARQELERGLLAMGRAAIAAGELVLAEFALGQAAELGPQGAAERLLARVADLQRERRDRRRDRARQLLREARAGRLGGGPAGESGAVQAAAFELARQASPEVVAVLVGALARWRDRFRAVTREALLEAGREARLEGVEAAVEAFLQTLAPSGAARRTFLLEPEQRALLARVFEALTSQDKARAGGSRERYWGEILAERQLAVARAQGARGDQEIWLVCTALGLVESQPRQAAEALARWLWQVWDQPLAVPAGVALARLGAREPQALSWLVELVQPGPGTRSMPHWSEAGPWWVRMRSELASRPVSPATTGGGDPLTQGLALRAQQRYAEALPLLERAIAAGDDGLPTRIAHADTLLQLGQLERALIALDRLASRAPQEHVVRSLRGLARLRSGDADGGLADLGEAARLAPQAAQPWRLRARALLDLGRHDEALADIDRAVGIDDDDRSLVLRARVQRARGQLEPALRDVGRVLERSPRDVAALELRAACLRDAERYPEALRDLERAIAINAAASLRVARADVLLSLRRHDEAIAACDELLAAEPARADAREVRAAAYARSGRPREAAADARRLVAEHPGRWKAWQALARVETAAGRHGAAVTAYDRAIQAAGQQPPSVLLFDRGSARLSAGDRVGAIADFSAALLRRPGFWQGYSMRALARQQSGDRDGALADYEQLLVRRPDHLGGLINSGDLLRQAGKLPQAAARFTRATTVAPNTWQAWAGLGQVRAAQAQRQPAIDALQRAAQLAPAPVAAQIRKQIAQLR